MLNRRELLKTACAVALARFLSVPLSSLTLPRASKLLFVHGRGQQGRDPVTLKSEWLAALKRGAQAIGQSVPADLDVAFPFYGDVLDRYTQQLGIPLTSDINARGNATDDEFLVFQAEFA